MAALPPETLVARFETLMGKRVAGWRRTMGGYTTAERWIATFEDGGSCFVKSGADHLADFLRAEFRHVYSRMQASFLPKLIAWDDDGVAPMLVLEDLSAAAWPPPWTHDGVRAVLQTLDTLQEHGHFLTGLPGVERVDLKEGWREVGRDPAPFLGLGLCSKTWLTCSLPTLIEANNEAPLEGNDVLHFDVRSDNLCFVEGRAVLVDWNHVCRGNRDLDVAAWLPSLHAEGGPAPEHVFELDAHWPALISGYFASYAGLPPIVQAPKVREVQLSQLRAALPWAQRALGLPPLDGANAP